MAILQMRPSSPSLWEESIQRRGQHVLWYSATACWCISNSGRVDPNCLRCFGRGLIYNPVRSTRQITWGMSVGQPTIDVSSKGIRIKSIHRLFAGLDTEVSVSSFTPTSFTPSTPIPKGQRYTLDFEADFEANYTGPATYVGRQLVEVPIKLVNNQNYFHGALLKVNSLRNETRGEDMGVVACWANRIFTSSRVAEKDELTVDCQYVMASKFLVMSINPKNKVDNNMILQEADAMMDFPGTFHVGRGDLILLQMAEIKETIVGINEGRSYIFPYQSVARVLSVEDKDGPITDFTLIRDNEVLWGERAPTRFSASFTYHPAFSVLEDVPTVRYAENKIWPKRVFLKKFSTFMQASRVLTMEPSDKGDRGLLDDPNKVEEQGGLV